MNNVIPHDVHNVTPSYVGFIQRNENNDVSNVSLQSKSSLKYRNRNARKKAMKYTKKEVHKLMNRERYITNLSSKTLSSPQLDVLSLGLTFVPNQVASPTLMSDSLDNFDRSNRLKYFFRNYPHTEPHPFRRKSTWTPPSASPEIEEYLKRIRKEVSTLRPLKVTPKLTPAQDRALDELCSDQTLVIKSADKGSGIVVEDTEQYVKDGLDHLSDESIYERVDADPTIALTEAINTYTDSMYQVGIIDPLTKEHLTLKIEPPPRTQQLYFLKKIHKNPIAVRPIVSGCAGPTENISQLVDLHLKPH